jgi:hypothetical protein
MYKRMLLSVVFTGLLAMLSGQNFIGLNKEDVIKLMEQEYPEFKLDQSSINRSYNYLKYVDEEGDQTLMYYLTEDGNCISSKLMGDYAILNRITNDLNSRYTKTGQYSWKYASGKQEYEVIITTDKWFFTVTTKKK